MGGENKWPFFYWSYLPKIIKGYQGKVEAGPVDLETLLLVGLLCLSNGTKKRYVDIYLSIFVHVNRKLDGCMRHIQMHRQTQISTDTNSSNSTSPPPTPSNPVQQLYHL